MKTIEEVFYETVNYVLSMKIKSYNHDTTDPSCVYRMFKDGQCINKCAAGYWISDESYSKKLEGIAVDTIKIYNVFPDYFTDEYFSVLSKLQEYHDMYAFTLDKKNLYPLYKSKKRHLAHIEKMCNILGIEFDKTKVKFNDQN